MLFGYATWKDLSRRTRNCDGLACSSTTIILCCQLRPATRQIEFLDAIELEYSEDGELHPSQLLGEIDGSRGAG